PKTIPGESEGRTLIRTGSVALDRRFNSRTDHPTEIRMLTAGTTTNASLEQLCCSSQTGLSIKDRAIELSELTIPPFTANHVFDHLQSMLALAKAIHEMPGADRIKVDPLPRRGSSWPVRVALAGGLVCLVALLFTQPYSHTQGANASINPNALQSGITPADAARMQQVLGWRVAKPEDFSSSGLRFLREHRLDPAGRITADFGGRGGAADS